MKKFQIQKILIPVDFSDTSMLALEHAVFMAKLYKAEITLLHVIESLSYTSAISHSFGESEFEVVIEKNVMEKLEHLAKSIYEQHKIKVHTKSEVGRIYKQVVEMAEHIKADLIIMGTHGVSGFREFLIGSNAYRVVSDAPCPVISVQTHAKKIGFKNLVVPVDDTLHTLQKIACTETIADKHGSTVYLLGLASEEDETCINKLKHKLKKVEEYYDKHDILHKSKILSVKSGLAQTVLAYAADVKADLIISMTEQEFDISGLLMGPAAQQIVNHSKVPVMSIRPEINPDNIQFM